MLSKKKVNLILFNYTCAACTIVVLIDITIQFIFGKNITGNISLPDTRHYSGMFGDEYIAGGYIQKFSLFIFVLPIINNLKKHKRLFVQFIFFIFIIFSIILSGNRMPLFLFLISFFIFLIFNKETRKYFFKLFLFTLIFLFILFKNIPHFKTNTLNFYNNGKFLITKIFDPTLNQIPATASVWKRPYVSEFYCAKESVKLNPIFGGGIKSYRVNSGCYTHPHNYFLEIISDLGIIGLILILFFVLKIFYKIVKNYLSKDLFSENFFKKTIPIFLILIIEFFPLRTSGSFFTTGNATIIFIMFAILVSFFNKSYKKK